MCISIHGEVPKKLQNNQSGYTLIKKKKVTSLSVSVATGDGGVYRQTLKTHSSWLRTSEDHDSFFYCKDFYKYKLQVLFCFKSICYQDSCTGICKELCNFIFFSIQSVSATDILLNKETWFKAWTERDYECCLLLPLRRPAPPLPEQEQWADLQLVTSWWPQTAPSTGTSPPPPLPGHRPAHPQHPLPPLPLQHGPGQPQPLRGLLKGPRSWPPPIPALLPPWAPWGVRVPLPASAHPTEHRTRAAGG